MTAASAAGAAVAARRHGYDLPNSVRAIITIAIMAASLMEVLDTSIVNVALPDMMGNLGATLDQIGWVSTGYIISNVIVLPLTGWLSDYFGRRRYLTGSVILFTIASFGCGVSRTLTALVAWRVLQGVGGAAFLSTAQATLMEVYPPNRRGLAQAIFGIGVIMAPTLGPTVGGYIAQNYNWPWIFFVNLPIGVVAAILTFAFVPDSFAAGGRRSADFAGIGLLALALGSLQTVLERGQSEDWFEANYIVVLTVLAAAGLIAFIWWETRRSNPAPAVDLRILRDRNLASGVVFAFALGFVLYGGVFVLPQFMQNVQSHTPEQAGLLLMPGGLASAAMMPIVGILADRIDKRILIAAGMIVFTSSMLTFRNTISLTMPDEAMYLPLVLRGAGIGLAFVPLSVLTLGTLRGEHVPQGTGLYNLARQLGGSFGIALLTTLIDHRIHTHASRLADRITAFSGPAVQRLQMIQGQLELHGYSAAAARQAALAQINHAIYTQSAVLTYADVFHLMAATGVGATVLLLLFRKPTRVARGMSAAH